VKNDLDLIAAGVDLYMELYLRAYKAWWALIEDVVDPRVWTHCRCLKYPDGHEELWCDGVLVGTFRTERDGLSTRFLGWVIRKADSPWRDPPVPGT
jgi:hypothetical protein